MKAASFVTASAEITSIVNLKKGDVYKRLETSDYSGDKIIHGIVLDVLYNGTDAAIQTMEFEQQYSNLKTEFKVFGGGKEIKIFPSSEEEVRAYLADCVKSLERGVNNAESALVEAHSKLAKAQEIVSGDLIKNLNTPEFDGGLINAGSGEEE